MLENTEGAIKKGQSRQSGNTKQSKNITQYVLDTTMRKQAQLTQTRHAPSYKQLEVKTNQTSFSCRHRKLTSFC